MAIHVEKPLPLMVGDKAYYTLTSYDPVEVEVLVPYVTNEDVSFALATLLRQIGGTPQDLVDPTWFKEHFPEMKDSDELCQSICDELTVLNQQFAEQQKAERCRAELAKRLKQMVPPAHVESARQQVRMQFEQSLAADGLTVETFMAQTGTTREQIERMIEQNGLAAAEESAAADAWAREKKLEVSQDEIAGLLGTDDQHAQEVLDQVRQAGMLDEFMAGALRTKAIADVIMNCSCTYHHETEQEAAQRVAAARDLRRQRAEGVQGEDGSTGFKLV